MGDISDLCVRLWGHSIHQVSRRLRAGLGLLLTRLATQRLACHVVDEFPLPFASQSGVVFLAEQRDFIPARTAISIVKLWWCCLRARPFSAAFLDAFGKNYFGVGVAV